MTSKILSSIGKALVSMRFTIACLGAMMILVVACTLAQVPLGTYEAVKMFIRSYWVYWPLAARWRIPVFPGGALVGLLLLLNVLAVQFNRLERSRRKAGLWLTHLGLIVLFLGEFTAGGFQKESEMALDQGVARNYAVDRREAELALIDATSPGYDLVYSVAASRLERESTIKDSGLPFVIRVRDYGVQPAETPDELGRVAATVMLDDGDSRVGTWELSSEGQQPQTFVYGNKTYRLALRPRRRYLPFSLTLEKFNRDVYPGTDIPKTYSSLLRLRDERNGEDRQVLISMNNPLRYGGRAFYQASFGKNDTMSILQVVANPGWLLPYIACVLIGAGLLAHFAARLLSAVRRPM